MPGTGQGRLIAALVAEELVEVPLQSQRGEAHSTANSPQHGLGERQEKTDNHH